MSLSINYKCLYKPTLIDDSLCKAGITIYIYIRCIVVSVRVYIVDCIFFYQVLCRTNSVKVLGGGKRKKYKCLITYIHLHLFHSHP